jgi:hypothetical protein
MNFKPGKKRLEFSGLKYLVRLSSRRYPRYPVVLEHFSVDPNGAFLEVN